MGYQNPNKTNLTAWVWSEQFEYVTARGKRINQSQADFCHDIINYWMAMGAPALNALDAAMPMPKMPIFPNPEDSDRLATAPWFKAKRR